ncbi:MAG: alpha-mannosidase [Spirochaetia bacterium]
MLKAERRIILGRLKKFQARVEERRYGEKSPLQASYIYDNEPIPYKDAVNGKYKPIQIGEKWGEIWGSGWFKFTGEVPADFSGEIVLALIDVDGEACVFENGEPVLGLTYDREGNRQIRKRRVPLFDNARGGEKVELLVEAAANGLFGLENERLVSKRDVFNLRQAELAVYYPDVWQFSLDLEFLISLAESLDPENPRSCKILAELNRAANVWSEGKGIEQCRKITRELLDKPAHASTMNVWSVGHAHLDLGWLWPVRETRRKGGRTFATALRLLEEYPEYRFGASQPQLFKWIKQDYPGLYSRIKDAVKKGRLECQGGMWVEPDMNLTSGESLVRQCLYGKRFFREEFGKDIRNLWLPDVFGYSPALPQILRKSGIDFFMTQKISWNEINLFPYHTFRWKGIDGTPILTHFLPTNNYNLGNYPKDLIESEKRFSQSDIQDDFLNLFGVGDGGGGPSRHQIEMGIRGGNTEGCPNVKISFAQDFFDKVEKSVTESLPEWNGELYLELHRGTYTTQAKMKKDNRRLEHLLRDTEILGVLLGGYPNAKLQKVWEDTMLNQFHDILPGSSITMVYDDAHEMSDENICILEDAIDEIIGREKSNGGTYLVYNTLSWDRTATISLPDTGAALLEDGYGRKYPLQRNSGSLQARVPVPAMGYNSFTLRDGSVETDQEKVTAEPDFLENKFIKVMFGKDGTITSIFDKDSSREFLAGPANRFLLWEDYPNSWEAWDINGFYRETTPEQAVLEYRKVSYSGKYTAEIEQRFSIGNSIIEQKIRVTEDSRLVEIANRVEWNEERKMLRVQAEPAVTASEASYEIQYGTIKRSTHTNTSWDQALFEVPAHRFADLSQPDHGFALINDCKYGHYVRNGIMDLTLLRSPKHPDPAADIGNHEFTFGYYPHTGDLVSSDVLEKAHEMNSPVYTAAVKEIPEEKVKSFFRISGNHVKLEVIKKAEDGSGVILRLYETMGTDTEVTLYSAEHWKSVSETDLMEDGENKIADEGNELSLVFTPFEIKSLKLLV